MNQKLPSSLKVFWSTSSMFKTTYITKNNIRLNTIVSLIISSFSFLIKFEYTRKKRIDELNNIYSFLKYFNILKTINKFYFNIIFTRFLKNKFNKIN